LPITSPVFSFTFPIASFAVPFALSSELEFILFFRVWRKPRSCRKSAGP
jgi:hypothetical protein